MTILSPEAQQDLDKYYAEDQAPQLTFPDVLAQCRKPPDEIQILPAYTSLTGKPECLCEDVNNCPVARYVAQKLESTHAFVACATH